MTGSLHYCEFKVVSFHFSALFYYQKEKYFCIIMTMYSTLFIWKWLEGWMTLNWCLSFVLYFIQWCWRLEVYEKSLFTHFICAVLYLYTMVLKTGGLWEIIVYSFLLCSAKFTLNSTEWFEVIIICYSFHLCSTIYKMLPMIGRFF